MIELLMNIAPEILTGGAAAGFAWFFARKRNKAEAEAVELDNVEKAVAIWRTLATDLKAEIATLKAEVEQLRQQQACPDCPHIKK